MSGRVEVITCSGFFYNPTKGIREHKHPIYQIFYIDYGNCVFWYEGRGINLEANNFLLVRTNAVHGLVPPPVKTSILDIKFNITDPEFETEILKLNPKYSGTSETITRLFQMIEEEAKAKGSYYSKIISLYLESIFCQLLRDQYTISEVFQYNTDIYEKLGIKYEQLSNCVRLAIAQMDGMTVCPIQRFSVQYLANTIGYSKRYLSETFSREMGCSLTRFMGILRIDKAKELLVHSSLSIKEIASMLDFRNESYFCTQFAEAVGQSPSNYRKHAEKQGKDYLNYSFHDEFDDEGISSDTEREDVFD